VLVSFFFMRKNDEAWFGQGHIGGVDLIDFFHRYDSLSSHQSHRFQFRFNVIESDCHCLPAVVRFDVTRHVESNWIVPPFDHAEEILTQDKTFEKGHGRSLSRGWPGRIAPDRETGQNSEAKDNSEDAGHGQCHRRQCRRLASELAKATRGGFAKPASALSTKAGQPKQDQQAISQCQRAQQSQRAALQGMHS